MNREFRQLSGHRPRSGPSQAFKVGLVYSRPLAQPGDHGSILVKWGRLILYPQGRRDRIYPMAAQLQPYCSGCYPTPAKRIMDI